jgi:hypothetical protein
MGRNRQNANGRDNQTSLDVPLNNALSLDKKEAAFYRTVLQLLNRHRVPYAIAGAFALHQHTGIWRVTKDLDIFMTAEGMSRALMILVKHFKCEVTDPVWLAKVRSGRFFIDLITGMSNAVFVVDDSWIDRARPAMVLGVKTKILGSEELLVSKLFVIRRERFDGADIAHIVYGSRERIQWKRVMDVVGDHWEILLWSLLLFRYVYPAHSAHVPAHIWDDLLTRLRKELANCNSEAPFRGSLVDDNMFAIDVNEWGLPDLLSEYRSRRMKSIGPMPNHEGGRSKGAAQPGP